MQIAAPPHLATRTAPSPLSSPVTFWTGVSSPPRTQRAPCHCACWKAKHSDSAQKSAPGSLEARISIKIKTVTFKNHFKNIEPLWAHVWGHTADSKVSLYNIVLLIISLKYDRLWRGIWCNHPRSRIWHALCWHQVSKLSLWNGE